MITSKKRLQLGILVAVFLVGGLFLGFDQRLFRFKADEVISQSTRIMLPVNNERFVYLNNPLIQGKTSSNATLKIYDNDSFLADITAEASGNFYYKPPGFANGIHKIKVANSANSADLSETYISIDTSDPSRAILKTQDTQIIENDHPWYGNGINEIDPVVGMMGKPAEIEQNFANAEKAGIKMLRVINYTLDDMALPNPTNPPVATVGGGGGLIPGTYVYRYTCANLSKNVIGITDNIYNTAETMPSDPTSGIEVGVDQKVTLALAPCAKSYRYLVYRRNASDPAGSETYLGFAEAIAGQNASFVDDGSYRPSGVWADPIDPPVLETQARSTDPKVATRLEAVDYVYRYIYKEHRKPVDGRYDRFVTGYSGTYRTAGSPSAQISVVDGQAVKISVPAQNSPWAAIFRRKASDPEGSEKYIANVRNVNGVISYVDEGVPLQVTEMPTENSTASQGISNSNETHDNPRSQWPTSESTAYMTGFGNWNENALIAADQVMALAKKYNIRIMFTFIDQHDVNTGGVREIARNCGATDSGYFSNTCSKNMTKEIIDKFITRVNTVTGMAYKDDPAIFAWEFLNEPYDTSVGGTFRSWIWEMGLYLKGKDPNHMLSSGDEGSIWFTHNYEAGYNGNNNHDLVMEGTPDPVDILTWHGYPESEGYMFNHGYYGNDFDPTNPAKRGNLDDAAAAAWIDKYGPVTGPIDIDTAIKQLKLHSHYATMLNKPIVFGEWGADWAKPNAKQWITSLSDAILTAKPDLIRGPNSYPDPNFVNDQNQYWIENSSNLNISVDDTVLYKNHASMKLLPTESNRTIISQKFSIKPNSPYWYEYKLNNPTTKSINISVNGYYKNGVKLNGVPLPSANYGQTVGWKTLNRYSVSACEFTTPDADQVDFAITFNNGAAGDEAWIGQIGFYELIAPTDASISNFSGTAWWAWPDATGLGNSENTEALKLAAVNFANRSMESLPALAADDGDDAPSSGPQPAAPTPPEVTLSSSNFSPGWNMVSFPNLISITNNALGINLGNGMKLRRFDTSQNSYQKGENTEIALASGAGYWLKIEDPAKINNLHYPLKESSSTEISVSKGWALLGNPFDTNLPLSNLQIKYKDGSTRSYADAIARKEVSGYAWSYEASEKQYHFVAISPNNYKTSSPKQTYISPFRGFWIIVKSDNISNVIINK